MLQAVKNELNSENFLEFIQASLLFLNDQELITLDKVTFSQSGSYIDLNINVGGIPEETKFGIILSVLNFGQTSDQIALLNVEIDESTLVLRNKDIRTAEFAISTRPLSQL